jgi:hypothetical protein
MSILVGAKRGVMCWRYKNGELTRVTICEIRVHMKMIAKSILGDEGVANATGDNAMI